MRVRSGNSVERWFEALFDFFDRRFITRRLMTVGTFLITLKVIYWSLDYAQNSPRSGTDIAAILAAIMVPLNGLMGYMFNQYVKGTSSDTTSTMSSSTVTVKGTP